MEQKELKETLLPEATEQVKVEEQKKQSVPEVAESAKPKLPKKKRCFSCFCCCRIAACTCVILPILAIIVCCVFYFSGMSRVDNILYFNSMSRQWNNTDINRFRDRLLNATVNDENYLMYESNATDISYYPVHDTCNEDGDPFDGCIDTQVLYYAVNVPSSSSYTFTVFEEGNQPFIDEMFAGSYNELVMNTTLKCTDVVSCTYECIKMGGKYTAKTGMCKIKKYLNHVCFRVAIDDHNYLKEDLPPALPLNGYEPSSNFTGCYGDRAWDYSHYGSDEPDEVVFEIRYYGDPYIIASSLTEGCSTDPETVGDYCMGLNRYQLKYGYVIGVGAMFVILAIELFIFTLMALLKKDNICVKKPKTPMSPETLV